MSELLQFAVQIDSIPSVQLDQIMNSLVEHSLHLCELCIKSGRERVEKPQPERIRYTWESEASQPSQNTTGDFKHPNSYCESCHKFTLTEKLTFRQNVAGGFRRYTRTVQGNLCSECAEHYFWQFSGKTILFGWWGLISFFVAPFFLLTNLWNYLRAWKLRRYAEDLWHIELGWKLVVFSVFCLVIYLFYNYGRIYSPAIVQTLTNSVVYQTTTPTSKPIIAPSRTPWIRPTPTNINALEKQCILWSKVTPKDEGKTLCVFGFTHDAYFGDNNIFYIVFSDDGNAFRFIVTNSYYFEGVKGNCVKADGEVKIYDDMPYIEVQEDLYHCE